MPKLTLKSGKNKLILRKSRKMVGIRLKTSRSAGGKTPEVGVKTQVHENLGGFKVVSLKLPAKTSLNQQLDALRESGNLESGTHVYHAEGSDKPLVPNGLLYVQFRRGVSGEAQRDLLAPYALDIVEQRPDDCLLVQVTAASPNPLKVAAALQALPEIKSAEPDFDIPLDSYAYAPPTDTLFAHEWFLQNPGFVTDNPGYKLVKGADARIVDAWKRLDGFGSTAVTIAIIDNGFDLTHPDLQGKVVKPFDFWNNSPSLSQGDPAYTHGTPCASIAIAPVSGSGLVGSAPNARFMPLSGTSFEIRTTERYFDYCIQNGADIISCSWGSTDPQFALNPLKEAAISKAARLGRNGKGCVILFAAGNDDLDYVSFYAAHPDVICVAASTSRDEYAEYSNRGPQVSICAPSNGDWPLIAARAFWDEGSKGETGAYRFWADGVPRGDRYKHFGGTSGATPLVAGICALVLSANPDLTAREVKDILQQTADKIGSPADYIGAKSYKFGYGRVNADRAVAEALRRKQAAGTPVSTPAAAASPTGWPPGIAKYGAKKLPTTGFGVQAASLSDAGNTAALCAKLEKNYKVEVYVQMAEAQGKKVFKVIAGAFAAQADAVALLNKVKKADAPGAFLKNWAG